MTSIKLLGYYGYRQELQAKYPENAWVTQSELFKPFYGYMISNYIIEKWLYHNYRSFRIIEIGPGTGALAESILEYLSRNSFERKIIFEYHGVEISEKLGSKIEQRLNKKYSKLLESGQVQIFLSSIFDYDFTHKEPGFVVGMEVLDNMPHDRLYKDNENVLEPWTHQTLVTNNSGEGDELEEEIVPISDPWGQKFVELQSTLPHMDSITMNKEIKRQGIINSLMQNMNSLLGRKRSLDNIFAPTATLKLFDHIQTFMPKHHLVLGDFDSFIMPRNSVNGINAPLVTDKKAKPSEWKAYDTYLIPGGAADICFPTDFYFIKHAYQQLTGKSATTIKNSEMGEKYAVSSWCETRNGFNPMREEYVNTSFLLS